MAYRKELWTAADVLCPLYKADDTNRRSIICEGCCSAVSNTSAFRSISAKNDHMGKYCAGKYETCPIYSMVANSKYSN